MAVSAGDIGSVPVRNLRIPRSEFAKLWEAANHMNGQDSDADRDDWYVAGVVVTCRWLAGAVETPPWGRPHPARSPVGDRDIRAYEESIEAEYQAAELIAEQRPWLLEQRPGWCEAIRATLRWAWRHDGPPPLNEAGEPTAWPAPPP